MNQPKIWWTNLIEQEGRAPSQLYVDASFKQFHFAERYEDKSGGEKYHVE
jgi:hypothetical protein